jgi:hypothetical protein
MDIILVGFWIWERARRRTKLEFQRWVQALDAEDMRMQSEAPVGWKSSPLLDPHRKSDLVEQRASSFSFSR